MRLARMIPVIWLTAACGSGSSTEPTPVPLPTVAGWPTDIQIAPVGQEKQLQVRFTREDGAPAPVTIEVQREKLGGAATVDEGWWDEVPETGVAELHFTPRGPIDVVVRLAYEVCPLPEEMDRYTCQRATLPGVMFLAAGGATAAVRADVSAIAIAVGETRPVSALTLTEAGFRSGTPVELESGSPALLRIVDDTHVAGVAAGETTLTFRSGEQATTIPVTVGTAALAPPTGLEEPAAAIVPSFRPDDPGRHARVALKDGFPHVVVEEDVAGDRDVLIYAWTGTGWGVERVNEPWRELTPLRYEIDDLGRELLLVRWAHAAAPDEHVDPSTPFLMIRAPGAPTWEYRRLPRWPGASTTGEGTVPTDRTIARPLDGAADVLVQGSKLFVATVAWAGAQRVVKVSEILPGEVASTDYVDAQPGADAPPITRVRLRAPSDGGTPVLTVDDEVAATAGAPVAATEGAAFFDVDGAPLLAFDPDACLLYSRGWSVACGTWKDAPRDLPLVVDGVRDELLSLGGTTLQRASARPVPPAADDLAPRLAELEAATLGLDPRAFFVDLEPAWRTARLRGATIVGDTMTFLVEREDGRLFVGSTEYGATPEATALDTVGRPLAPDAVDGRDLRPGPAAALPDGSRLVALSRSSGGNTDIVHATATGAFEVVATRTGAIWASAAGVDGLYVLAPVVGGAELVRYAAATGARDVMGTVTLAAGATLDRLVVLPGGQLVAGGTAGLWFAPAGGAAVSLTLLVATPSGVALAGDASGFTAVVAQAGDSTGTATRVLHYDTAGAVVDDVTTATPLYLIDGARLGAVDWWPAPSTGGTARVLRSATTYRDATATELGFVFGAPRVAARADGGLAIVFAHRFGWRDVRLAVLRSSDAGATFDPLALAAPTLGRLQFVSGLAATPAGILATTLIAPTLSSDGTGEPALPDGAPNPFVDGYLGAHVLRVWP